MGISYRSLQDKKRLADEQEITLKRYGENPSIRFTVILRGETKAKFISDCITEIQEGEKVNLSSKINEIVRLHYGKHTF